MTISVIDFYRKIEDTNPFIKELKDPTFFILAYVNGKMRELTLKLVGNYPYIGFSTKDFQPDAYKNYHIILNFIKGERSEAVRKSWGLTTEDFNELKHELGFTLIKSHATCGWFKKVFLMFKALLRSYFGGIL